MCIVNVRLASECWFGFVGRMPTGVARGRERDRGEWERESGRERQVPIMHYHTSGACTTPEGGVV